MDKTSTIFCNEKDENGTNKMTVTICLVKNKDGVETVTTNWHIAAQKLADAHNAAVEAGAVADADFPDSVSGWHCSMWSADGECLCAYGEDESILVDARKLTAEEIEEDMFNVLPTLNG